MVTAVENLSTLERRITLSFPLVDVKTEVENRLRTRARTAKAPGFRPGKVPIKMVAAQFGQEIESDVLNEKLNRAFTEVTQENKLRVAGFPKIEAKVPDDTTKESMVFEATFEIYPEIVIGELNGVEIESPTTNVSDVEIDKTVDILRKQRVHYHVRGREGPHGDGGLDQKSQNGDRVTIDFEGKLNGEIFEGGKAEDYVFVLGEGRMLPQFEEATLGMLAGTSKTFPLTFPENYHGKDVAGKAVEFSITMKNIEWPHLPVIDAEFAKSLGVVSGSIEEMRTEIRKNLEREVASRIKTRVKNLVMDALIKVTNFDVPKTLLTQEINQLQENMRTEMTQRGMQLNNLPFPSGLFAEKAERRVRLGLILAELIKQNELRTQPEQIKAQIEEMAKSYEAPEEVVKYYFSDRNRLSEIEAVVIEDSAVNFVLNQVKRVDVAVEFDALMKNNTSPT